MEPYKKCLCRAPMLALFAIHCFGRDYRNDLIGNFAAIH